MGRMRGCLWLTTGVIVALLAGVVGYMTLSGAAGSGGSEQTAAGPVVSVVSAARDIEVRTLLVEQDLVLREMPVETLPQGVTTLSEIKDAVGKLTLSQLYSGEIILAQRLVDPTVVSGDGRVAVLVAGDEVLMAFPAEDLMSRINVLKAGDKVDLLFTLDFPAERVAGGAGNSDEEPATFNLLQNLSIAAIVGAETTTGGVSNTPQAILFTVDPQDALVLKAVADAGGILDIVLRAPGADQPFEVEPVDIDFLINRYQIPIGAQR